MLDCLLDITQAVALAKPATDHLTKDRIRDFEARYQSILDDGYAANPLSARPAHARKDAQGALDAIARVFTGNPFVPRFNTS